MTTVLCTNGLQSKALSVVRSLGSRGVRVVVGEKQRFHSSGFSKYAAKSLVYPDPKASPDAFFEWCVETVQKERIDVLVPMDDDVLDVLVPRQSELQQICRLLVPPLASYEIAADKGRTMLLAAQLGIPHPKTVTPCFGDTVDTALLAELARELTFPVAIKPRASAGSRGIRFASDVDELLRIYPQIHSDYPNPLLQERIPLGAKYDVCVLYDSNAQLKASFVQHEIRNYPIPNGPSTVRESVHYPELVQISNDLMKGIPWCSVADVEFMIDPRTDRPMLLEINPRFWSSLELAVLAGVDFPFLLLELALGLQMEPVTEYSLGVMGRSLLPSDILHFLSNPNRSRIEPPFFTTKIPDDIVALRDIGPLFGFALSALRNGINPNTWKFLVRR